MKEMILAVLLIAGGTSYALAQSGKDYPKNELFAGYSYNSADINTVTIDPKRTSQNGVNLSYTRNVTNNLGITGDISAHFHGDTRRSGAGEFKSDRDQYYLVGGIQFKPQPGGRIKPFVRALFGVSLFRGFTSDLGPSGNVFTFDDATSFAMALGGGVDVRISKRIDLRVVQADYIPTFFGSGRQDNVRLSFGIVITK